MPTPPRRGRPRPFGVGAARVRIERGPDTEGRWYWRAIHHRVTFWSGWASRAEAEAAVIAHVARWGYDKAPEVDGGPSPDVRTVEDLLRAWVAYLEDDCPDLAERTVEGYRSTARRLVRLTGAVQIERLPGTLARVRAQLVREYAATTANVTLEVLGTAWTWARGVGLAPDEKLSISWVKVPTVEKRTPTEAEVLRVLGKMDGWTRLAAWAIYETGGRPVDVAQAELRPGGLYLDGKTGARWVPITSGLHTALTEYAASHPYPLWHVTMGSFRTAVFTALQAACEVAKVEPFSAVSMRRLRSDLLMRAGVDVGTYAAWMGHSPTVALKHYRQARREDLQAAAALLYPSKTATAGEVIEGPWRHGSTQRSTHRPEDDDK